MQKSLEKSIIIDVGITYTRVGILEENKTSEIFLENKRSVKTEGSIYQGRVANIVKGIKAAFIEIGREKKGFLHFNDISENFKGQIQNNQRVAVQIVKEGINEKGPKVTTLYNIKSEFLVLLPAENTIGISKKITDKSERKRLRELASEIIQDKYGLIVRTKSKDLLDEQFQEELIKLIDKWEKIKPRISTASVGEVLHKEPSLIMKVVRENFHESIKEIVINSQKEAKEIIDYIEGQDSDSSKLVRIVDKTANLYDSYGLNKDIKRALGKQIWLKSGANIIIEQTEAMHVIDVNTAKSIKIKNKDKMLLKANIEAAKESVRQIKLRNLSGIIVIDFIDMNNDKDKNTIFNIMANEFKDDTSKVKIYPINDLGLLHISRQKKYNSLKDEIMVPCTYCKEEYGHKNFAYTIVEIEEDIRGLIRNKINRRINIELSSELYKYMSFMGATKKLENKYDIEILLVESLEFKENKYKTSINPK